MEASKQEKTENELIAEFMGATDYIHENSHLPYLYFPVRPHDRANTIYRVGSLRYSTSWDWLIPVVEKITPIAKEVGQQAWFDIKYSLTDARIDLVYRRVVEFIKWYNSQKPLPL